MSCFAFVMFFSGPQRLLAFIPDLFYQHRDTGK